MRVIRWSLFAVVLALVFVPSPALAHAALVSSTPAGGAELSTAPGVVELRFSEPINIRLSSAEVTDPSGEQFGSAARTERRMMIRLSTNAPGVYDVKWKTVSPLDGHTLRGTFSFGVGVAPPEHGEVSAPGPSAADLPIGAARAALYAGLLTAVGVLLMSALARREPQLPWVRPSLKAPLAIALAGGLVVSIGEGLQAAGGASIPDVAGYLTTGLPGVARLALVGSAAVALVSAMLGSRFVMGALAVAFPAVAASGHAAAVRPEWWGIGVDTVHLVSAGLWAGSIFALALVHPPGGWRGPQGADLLRRFTPFAIPAFLVTVGTGSLRAAQELDAPFDLLNTSYGRVLSLKLIAVAIMVPLSVYAWRRLTGSVRTEAVFAASAVVAAALLALYPVPPGRAEEAEEAAAGVEQSADALPREGDLTLGGDAGEVLVGLTLRPGTSGRNDAFVYVDSVSEAPPQEIPVQMSAQGRRVTVRPCGPKCRRASLTLSGGERIEVRVPGRGGGRAVFDVPELPAPKADQLLKEANRRMGEVETVRVSETLGPVKPVIRSEYAFRAPDQMSLDSTSGYGVVAMGTTQYQRFRGSPRWQKSADSSPVKAPYFTWVPFEPIDVREVGAERVDGVETRVISFFTGDQDTPIWFRLSIDDHGLVRRMEMRALGHVMDQRIFSFDRSVRIEAPAD